jgi:hypothetical protein
MFCHLGKQEVGKGADVEGRDIPVVGGWGAPAYRDDEPPDLAWSFRCALLLDCADDTCFSYYVTSSSGVESVPGRGTRAMALRIWCVFWRCLAQGQSSRHSLLLRYPWE